MLSLWPVSSRLTTPAGLWPQGRRVGFFAMLLYHCVEELWGWRHQLDFDLKGAVLGFYYFNVPLWRALRLRTPTGLGDGVVQEVVHQARASLSRWRLARHDGRGRQGRQPPRLQLKKYTKHQITRVNSCPELWQPELWHEECQLMPRVMA